MKALRIFLHAVIAVSLAVLALRGIEGERFREYRRRGGQNGFFGWFAKDVCGVNLPGVEDEDVREEEERAERAAKRKAEKARMALLKAEAAKAEQQRLADEAKAKELERKRAAAKKAGGANAAAKDAKRRGNAKKGGKIHTGGRSVHTGGDGLSPYHVSGIRGIEFGSTENAPAENVKPVLGVRMNDDGTMEFARLHWREMKELDEPIYGFDRAQLNHSYDSEELATVALHKNFPFTEEGMRQAMEFYRTMSAEASADLGFEVKTVDNTGNSNASVCGFSSDDGDTTIHGGVYTWSDKTITVSLSVADKAYNREMRKQSQGAYESGIADTVDARVEVVNRDYSEQMDRASRYLDGAK